MKKSITSPSGYQMNEYMLVIQPHEELRNKIVQLKKEFAQKFEAPSAEWGKSHITLVRFSQLQIMEERMFNRLRIIAMAMPTFKVDLANFGSYPSHTIYINVECKVAILELIKHLKALQSLFKTKETKPHFMDHFLSQLPDSCFPGSMTKVGWNTAINILQENLLPKRCCCYVGTKEKKPIKSFSDLSI